MVDAGTVASLFVALGHKLFTRLEVKLASTESERLLFIYQPPQSEDVQQQQLTGKNTETVK